MRYRITFDLETEARWTAEDARSFVERVTSPPDGSVTSVRDVRLEALPEPPSAAVDAPPAAPPVSGAVLRRNYCQRCGRRLVAAPGTQDEREGSGLCWCQDDD